jgi:hypothetical protein
MEYHLTCSPVQAKQPVQKATSNILIQPYNKSVIDSKQTEVLSVLTQSYLPIPIKARFHPVKSETKRVSQLLTCSRRLNRCLHSRNHLRNNIDHHDNCSNDNRSNSARNRSSGRLETTDTGITD